MQKAVRYGLLLIFIIILLPLSSQALNHYEEIGKTTYKFLPFYITQVIMYSLVGIVWGLFDRTIDEFRKPGKWCFDITRFIILGLPCLYVSLSLFIYWLPIQSFIINYALALRAPVICIIQLLTGYVLVTCFYKSSVIERYTHEPANLN